MQPRRTIAMLATLAALCAPAIRAQEPEAETPEKKTVWIGDILKWKRVGATTLSDDGQWFAHVISPAVGDSEMTLRSLESGEETRYEVGDGGGRPVFSDDSRWMAFTIAAFSCGSATGRQARWTRRRTA